MVFLNFETPLRLFISYWYNKVIALLTERATCVSSKGSKQTELHCMA